MIRQRVVIWRVVRTWICHFFVHLLFHVVWIHQFQQLNFALCFVFCEEHVVDAVLYITFFLAEFERGEVWVVARLCKLVQIYEFWFHIFWDWWVLRFFVEISAKDYGDVFEIILKELDDLFCLHFPVFHERFLCLQMGFTEHKLLWHEFLFKFAISFWCNCLKFNVHKKLRVGSKDLTVLRQALELVNFVKYGWSRDLVWLLNKIIRVSLRHHEFCNLSIKRENINLAETNDVGVDLFDVFFYQVKSVLPL